MQEILDLSIHAKAVCNWCYLYDSNKRKRHGSCHISISPRLHTQALLVCVCMCINRLTILEVRMYYRSLFNLPSPTKYVFRIKKKGVNKKKIIETKIRVVRQARQVINQFIISGLNKFRVISHKYFITGKCKFMHTKIICM